MAADMHVRAHLAAGQRRRPDCPSRISLFRDENLKVSASGFCRVSHRSPVGALKSGSRSLALDNAPDV
ncbi:hypothetical protein J1614_002109 [Plenodomus biglobosus]|nr:hypothetical protein J1614_002109 [Plenodomus biglobosus]